MFKYSCLKSPSVRKQQGAVLIIVLIVALTLTIIAIASLQNTRLQERISANVQQMTIATQSADSLFREAEDYIKSLSDTSGFSDSKGLYTVGNAPKPFDDSTWKGSKSIVSTGSYQTGVTPPRYFIEVIGSYGQVVSNKTVTNYGYTDGAGGSNITVFRIVTQGTGKGKAKVIMEAYYGRVL